MKCQCIINCSESSLLKKSEFVVEERRKMMNLMYAYHSDIKITYYKFAIGYHQFVNTNFNMKIQYTFNLQKFHCRDIFAIEFS